MTIEETAENSSVSAVTYSEKRVLPYTSTQLFDLVADVEDYPQFLPCWQEAKVFAREENTYYTDQLIRFGLMHTRFRSKTTLDRPRCISITSSEGLFRHFSIRWEFTPQPDGSGCQVQNTLACETRSVFLRSILDVMLRQMARTIIDAFEQRAAQLYGSSASLSSRD